MRQEVFIMNIIYQAIITQLKTLATGDLSEQFIHLPNGNWAIELTTGFDGINTNITLSDYDTYSVVMKELMVHQAASVNLQQWADRVVERVTYLDEALAIIEFDPHQQVAQLRSVEPYQIDDTLTYWEVMLSVEEQPTAQVARYLWEPTTAERTILAHPITYGTVARLVQDVSLFD